MDTIRFKIICWISKSHCQCFQVINPFCVAIVPKTMKQNMQTDHPMSLISPWIPDTRKLKHGTSWLVGESAHHNYRQVGRWSKEQWCVGPYNEALGSRAGSEYFKWLPLWWWEKKIKRDSGTKKIKSFKKHFAPFNGCLGSPGRLLG